MCVPKTRKQPGATEGEQVTHCVRDPVRILPYQASGYDREPLRLVGEVTGDHSAGQMVPAADRGIGYKSKNGH